MAALADTVSGLITKYVQICKDVSTDSQLQSKNMAIQYTDSEKLQKYIDRAITMRQDEMIKKYCDDVIKSMTQYFQNERSLSEWDYDFSEDSKCDNSSFPFWIICSSSGTGKSQFAYTLPMPVVYMLMETITKSTEQELYSPFISISDQFQTVLTEDYNNFKKNYRSEEKLSVANLLNAKHPSSSEDYKFSTIGFIVDLLVKMVTCNDETSKIHWLKRQHSVTTINCHPLTIMEGFARLSRVRTLLPEEYSKLPFVFIQDECQFDIQDNKAKGRFRYLKNLMRAIRICFVAMGTNANACNFTDKSTQNNSRGPKSVWCHLLFKLPTVSRTVLEETKVMIFEAAKEKNAYQLTKEFINSFFDLFRDSRPLFLHYAFRFIKEYLEKWNEESFANFFQKILERINDNFCKVKNIVDSSFIIGQFTYFTMTYWMGVNKYVLINQNMPGNPPGLKAKKNLRDFFCSAGLVNRHLACVGPPLRVFEEKLNIIMLNIYTYGRDDTKEPSNSRSKKTKGLGYTIDSSELVSNFYHYSWYSTFNEEPLVGLAFSTHQRSFPSNRTTLNALAEILSDKRIRNFMNDNSKLNGYLLELAVTTACVVSSHASGFNGMKFRDWLPRFFDELNFFDFVAGINDKCNLISSQEFLASCRYIDIPYFCPQVSFEFSSELVKMIRKIEPSFNPGSVYCNIEEPNESHDFHFTANGEVILNGECKLRENNLDISELNEIIKGFESLKNYKKVNMHIVVAKSIAEFISEDIPDNYLIYKAKFFENQETKKKNVRSSEKIGSMTTDGNLAKKSKDDFTKASGVSGKCVPKESCEYVIERIFPKLQPLKFDDKKVIVLVGLYEIAHDKEFAKYYLDYFKQ